MENENVVSELEIEETEERLQTLAEEEQELEEASEMVDFSTVEEEDVTDESILTITNASDPIKLYLREIGRIPLLTQEKERELAKKIAEGKEAQAKAIEIENDTEHTTAIEEYDKLLDIVEIGENARDKLIESNLRLVVAICKKYLNRGLQFGDLIQEGNMGLCKAADKFDYTKEFKFSTYATWWIRQSVTRALADQSRTIRIPVHMVETINLIKRTERELMMELGRDPNENEVSERTGIPLDKLNRIKTIASNPISLETKVGEEEDSTLGDFIADESSLTPYEYTEQKKLKEDINDLLDSMLSEREKMVIECRFGLNGREPMTLEEVARAFVPQVTRERIRQIEAKALRRIARSPKARSLKDYIKR